jgi:hypothetical protein
MKFKEIREKTISEAVKSPQMQSNSNDLKSKVMMAKTALGLKDVNASAAAATHKLIKAHKLKNPNSSTSQILKGLTPNVLSNYLKLTSSVPAGLLDTEMPQFRTTLQKLKTSNMREESEYVEVDILDVEQISEAIQDEIQLAPMLVLRRKGIRIFPDGRRVALYTNDKLGLVFTIPYMPGNAGTLTPTVIPGVQTEEVEEIMESLDQVAKYAQENSPKQTSRHMKFADGSKLKVSHGAAKAIHMVHGALNDENKNKFADMLTNPKGFEKAAHFALSKVQFTIGGK